jgi:acyl-ACP thioesterase
VAEAPWVFSLPFEVRDYEIDLQDIVNNSVYLNYFEHARHAFQKLRGLDFAAMHEERLDAVVYHVELDYRESLRSGETFAVRLRAEREALLTEDALRGRSGLCVPRQVSTGGEGFVPWLSMLTRKRRRG